MLLAIDIGNTNITLGVWNGRCWQNVWRLRTAHERTADEYGIMLTNLLREANLLHTITHIIMSSVVPALTLPFKELSQTYLNLEVLTVGPELKMNIRVTTDNPKEVGADRIVNAAAAYHLTMGPSITIDMGTATTFDVVSGDGALIGVAIAPGLRLASDALAARAAQLSQVPLEAPPHAIGRNTVQAVQSGLIFGYVALVEGMVTRIKKEHPDQGQPIHIIGTGGLINILQPHTDIFDTVDPWLTLTGLRVINESVRGKL